MIKTALLLFIIALAPCLQGQSASEDTAATLIEMSGEVFYEADKGSMKPAELGQFFIEGDRLQTKEASSLQLVLADGSTLTLGPNSELSIASTGNGDADSESLFELIKGSVNAIVEKLKEGASFEIKTAHSVAAVKGTQFEVSADEAESAVTVQEGVVAMSDLEHKKTEAVHPFQRCSGSATRLSGAFDLSKREAGEFKSRWERARMIHGQRREIMKAFEQHLHEPGRNGDQLDALVREVGRCRGAGREAN